MGFYNPLRDQPPITYTARPPRPRPDGSGRQPGSAPRPPKQTDGRSVRTHVCLSSPARLSASSDQSKYSGPPHPRGSVGLGTRPFALAVLLPRTEDRCESSPFAAGSLARSESGPTQRENCESSREGATRSNLSRGRCRATQRASSSSCSTGRQHANADASYRRVRCGRIMYPAPLARRAHTAELLRPTRRGGASAARS